MTEEQLTSDVHGRSVTRIIGDESTVYHVHNGEVYELIFSNGTSLEEVYNTINAMAPYVPPPPVFVEGDPEE